MNKPTNIEIYNATNYMHEYELLLEDYNLNIGLLGRLFEKLFGTNKYYNIEKYLKDNYNLSWSRAAEILRNAGKENDIFCPLKKNIIKTMQLRKLRSTLLRK